MAEEPPVVDPDPANFWRTPVNVYENLDYPDHPPAAQPDPFEAMIAILRRLIGWPS